MNGYIGLKYDDIKNLQNGISNSVGIRKFEFVTKTQFLSCILYDPDHIS